MHVGHCHVQIANAHLGVCVAGDALDREIADFEIQPQIAVLRYIERHVEIMAAVLRHAQHDLGLRSIHGKLANPMRCGGRVIFLVRRNHQAELIFILRGHYVDIADVCIQDHDTALGEGRLTDRGREVLSQRVSEAEEEDGA
jgi:hypothetical protein